MSDANSLAVNGRSLVFGERRCADTRLFSSRNSFESLPLILPPIFDAAGQLRPVFHPQFVPPLFPWQDSQAFIRPYGLTFKGQAFV
jgi:hypothetical protein